MTQQTPTTTPGGRVPGRRRRAPAPAPARSAIGVNVQIEPPERTVAVGPGHGLSFWAVVVVGLALIVITGGTGHWSQGFWLALLILLIVGALFPPAALVIGGMALLYLVLTHGQEFTHNVTALLAPPGQESPAGGRP